MEPHQEKASIGRPPFLISENDFYWKVRMQYFLKMPSEKVWNVVEFGWSPPKVLDREDRPTNVIKPKLEWDRATCTLVKEAWDILQVTHEETNAVKVSKLQILTSKFETIRMEDHENFGEVHAKLMDIVNSSFNLVKDVDSLKVDELVGSLQTFEMTLGSPRKSKGIALNALKEDSLGFKGEGNRSFFTNFTEFNGGNVTFGDGNVASGERERQFYAPGIPNLEEVLYVEGLKLT
ncbi:hypothetical protein CK203_061056 [Vitis vinifera]|uniref:DUF4219 domain-containing protein n=1 Tax=Vitis vinifera TaxID=29760 RepID=A0A438GLE5_VITVI|nr:hypothetical protein CK203_061056 [Vitis vinifera]